MSEPVRVTVSDPDTFETLGEQVIDNDYIVICSGNRYVKNTQVYANGTHVITVAAATGEVKP